LSVEERGDRFRDLEEAYKDYTVYDQHYEKIGKVDDLFVDEHDQPEYIGVKTGFLGMKSTLIPMELARVNDRRKLIEVAADKHTVTEGPAFGDDEEITPDHEARIYGYYGLQHPGLQEGRGGYGDYYASDPAEGHTGEDLAEQGRVRRATDAGCIFRRARPGLPGHDGRDGVERRYRRRRRTRYREREGVQARPDQRLAGLR
jgi:hypothetical protein